MIELQTTSNILMVRPAAFRANPQTAESNSFQERMAVDATASQLAAVTEFDAVVAQLRAANVNVHVFQDTLSPATPDAIFPNNWVSFHADGTTVLYPMLALNRRLERRVDILEALDKQHGYHIRQIVDLTHCEQDNSFLEGTGSLVLDRVNRVAYACLSPRTHIEALGEFAHHMGYDVVAFNAVDATGKPIYHTNVMMTLGRHFAAVCVDSIAQEFRDDILDRLRSTGHQLIHLTQSQLAEFAGNVLELATTDGRSVVALSRRAANAFSAQQREMLLAAVDQLVVADIATIERVGGGSIRCMLAEIHLPRSSVT
jgi:hypothetical protein